MKDPDRRLAVILGLWGAWLAWALTGPGLLATINWDQGAYIAKSCAPGGHWSDGPWNAHFAIGHVYEFGRYLTTALGGTIIDGFRLMDAIAFGLTMAILGDACRRLSGDRWLGALCALVWASSWVNLFFLFTLEDNVLYLPAAAGLFWLVVARGRNWGRRECVWAAVLAAWAALQSWQALYYLGPAGYAALLLTRGNARTKLWAAAEVVALFFGTLLGWCVIIALTSQLKLVELVRSMFSRPTGSFNLSPPSTDFWGRVTGLGAGWMLTHTFMGEPRLPLPIIQVGWCVVALLVVTLAVCTWVARRTHRWELHLLSLTLLLFTLVTPLYHDFAEWRYLVRFDFWPILGVLLMAAAIGRLARWRGTVVVLAPLLGWLIVWNTTHALEWSRETRRSHPSVADWTRLPHSNDAFYGRDGMPWFEFFRGVHRVAPSACRYVLALGEASEGWWNPDLMGSMFSELRGPVVLIGDPRTMGHSRYFTPPIVPPEDAVKRRLVGQGCEWVSRDASRSLAWKY